MIDLYALDQDALAALLAEWGHKSFRARQLHGWLYERGARDVDDMSNLPRALRERLIAETTLGRSTVSAEQQSNDGTIKRLSKLHDGRLIESVLMPYADGRRTACISTQAGCAMGCVFCATGQMGFERHLDAGEILEQAVHFALELKARGERLSNVVLMGMGEPFHNYDHTLAAVRRLMSDLGIGARHITISTVGIVPRIRAFAREGLQVKLAISLHADTDEARSALLPVNKRYNVDALMDACREYVTATGRRVTFEWALIAGENDDIATAQRLASRIGRLKAHVNLIPLNPTGGFGGSPTAHANAQRFAATLEAAGVPATVRVRRGIDIDAGCGQLRERTEA